MSLSEKIRAMIAEKEEQNRREAEQRQAEEEEQRRLLAEFQDQLPILLHDVILPKLREVRSALNENEHIEADMPDEPGRVVLAFSPSDNMYGTQFRVTFYGMEGIRALGVSTGSGSNPEDPFREERHLELSSVTPEWLDRYLEDFIKRAIDSEKLI